MLYVFIDNRSSYDGTYDLNDDDYREDDTDDDLGIDPHWRTRSASHGNPQGVRAAGGASGVEMTTVTRENSTRYSSNPIRESK